MNYCIGTQIMVMSNNCLIKKDMGTQKRIHIVVMLMGKIKGKENEDTKKNKKTVKSEYIKVRVDLQTKEELKRIATAHNTTMSKLMFKSITELIEADAKTNELLPHKEIIEERIKKTDIKLYKLREQKYNEVENVPQNNNDDNHGFFKRIKEIIGFKK